MVDAGELGARAGVAGGDEVGRPSCRRVGAAEEHRRAVGRRDRRQVGLPRAAVARERPARAARSARSAERDRVGALDRDRGHARAVVARRLVVDEDPRLAVAPQLHRLGAVLPGVAEAHARSAAARGPPPAPAPPPARRTRSRAARPAGGQLVLEQQQRAHRVDRHPPRVGLAEDVVEHLERERPVVAGREHVRRGSPRGRSRPGPGSSGSGGSTGARPSPAPARRRAGGRRSSRPGCRGSRAGSAPRERMWKESRQVPRLGWSPRLRDPPRVVVVAHVAPPGERLVGDPDPVRGGALGQLAQLRGGERVVVDRVRRDVGADQHRVGAELLHDRELRLRAPQVGGEALLGHRLEVAQRLVERDLEPERRRSAPRTSAGVRGAAIRSGSNSSTASKPAAAAAASFSSSVPLRQTVAIERRITPLAASSRRRGRACGRGRAARR